MRLLSELQDFLSWPHCIMAKMNEKKLEIQNVMSCFSAKEMLTLNVYNFVETSKRCTGVFKAADRVAHKNLRRLVKMKSFEPS